MLTSYNIMMTNNDARVLGWTWVVFLSNRGHKDFGYNVKGSQEYIGDVIGTKVKNVLYIV
jgi:hypothetical protein